MTHVPFTWFFTVLLWIDVGFLSAGEQLYLVLAPNQWTESLHAGEMWFSTPPRWLQEDEVVPYFLHAYPSEKTVFLITCFPEAVDELKQSRSRKIPLSAIQRALSIPTSLDNDSLPRAWDKDDFYPIFQGT